MPPYGAPGVALELCTRHASPSGGETLDCLRVRPPIGVDFLFSGAESAENISSISPLSRMTGRGMGESGGCFAPAPAGRDDNFFANWFGGINANVIKQGDSQA